jgi:hypothetical protein
MPHVPPPLSAHPARRLITAQEIAAYKELGVRPIDVLECVRITPFLTDFGGRARCLAYLRASDSLLARRFIECYDNFKLSYFVRYRLPLEAFCIKAGISPLELLKEIGASARAIYQIQASMAAAEAHPAIVGKSIELAKEGDVDHTTLQMKHMAFLPLPKGSQVQVNVNASANAASSAQSATVAAPAPENTIRGLVNRFNLPAKTQAILAGESAGETIPAIMPGDSREMMNVDADDSEEDDSFTANDMSRDE